ncbi:hypothetical protein N7499_003018 [Penicillium canescens]|uniref:Uncharacterized protein n=1 Tax=Penicillium canescens TaxID=5083 RepID=A0AAD6IAV6_PENCN|nr:uncharacterized protein N7446_011896 [Penicillium canescens]KAJ6019855.1 hypothetical protein N7522_000563 [Penicillium canescens]KAJ6039163.1 hypothetical protein N7460_007195 [Penicillium canescens]KAJ6047062.1 hypothetical protein N7446_011896 [Penicillium canescens]KAJ6059810.1 hypothetical protein N7444_003449 [Penicillium canescens]KAJ6093687.1 hypothetical protein N7499_003018 [Penicillium canescens]
MTRFFSPGSSRETVLFGGPDPNPNPLSGFSKSGMPKMSKEQVTLSGGSGSGVLARDSPPIRLHFPPNELTLMEDIKRRGLDDVVFDAIALQELGDQHQAQDDHGITHEAFLVDLAVLEVGISRFVPLSGDDPIILQQPVEDLDLKKALCYQRLHSKYSQEYVKRQRLTEILGVEMNKLWTDWYDDCLREIGNRFRKLGYC